jgi:hypothetical protein
MLKWSFKAGWRGSFALAVALTAAAIQANAQSASAIPIAPQAAPHPLTQGMPVVDQAGVSVGVITAVADSEQGPMVVVKVDGKLVSIPQSTLTLDGAVVRSSQTRAQILATAMAH